MNSTLRLALRNPKEPIGDFPTEMLKIAAQGSAPANAAPAAALQLTVPAAPAARPNAGTHGVTVIDGDRIDSGPTGSR